MKTSDPFRQMTIECSEFMGEVIMQRLQKFYTELETTQPQNVLMRLELKKVIDKIKNHIDNGPGIRD